MSVCLSVCLSLWMSSKFFSSNRYSSYSFSLILTKLGTRYLCAIGQNKTGTDFQNFDFKIFDKFFFYNFKFGLTATAATTGCNKGKKVKVHVDLYSALDDKYLVLKALRHGSHSLTCKQHHACL